jgi:hypothetical protein
MKYEGGCLCGAVRYATGAQPINERICHCRKCQKAIGAAFNARLLFRADEVDVSGLTAEFNSSEDLARVFCPRCGTTVFSSRRSTGNVAITAGTLDDPGLFRPDMHFWTAARQPWVKLDDGLPQFPEGPPD